MPEAEPRRPTPSFVNDGRVIDTVRNEIPLSRRRVYRQGGEGGRGGRGDSFAARCDEIEFVS